MTQLHAAHGVITREGVAHGATPKAKLGGGSCSLLVAVRAARQPAMIDLPAPAHPPHPTTYPWHHFP